jgi:DNA-directed RNA polymerase subunit M/transcription elongation factor TFIIS
MVLFLRLMSHHVDRRKAEGDRRGARRTTAPKFPCPTCGQWLSSVVPYKPPQTAQERRGEAYVRLRECQACHTQWTTEERFVAVFRKRTAA